MKTKTGGWIERSLLFAITAVVSCSLIGAQQSFAKGNSNRSDKCKGHDKCREHDKCRQHDRGHSRCKPKVDKCKDHDKCKEHDKCRQHDKGHARCKPKVDKCKDHDRCREHDKCRQHDWPHRYCRPKNDPCKDHDRCKEHDKCREHDRGHGKCQPKADRCKDRCVPHDKCRKHDRGHENCQPRMGVESYSGRAIVVHLTNLLHGPPEVLIGDTGPLAYNGGTFEVDVDGTNVQDFLIIDMAGAITSGVSNEAVSEVAIGGFTLKILATNGTLHTITFDSMHVVASAVCESNGPAVSASVGITGLKVDDEVITITGEPNQRIDYDGGHILVNAQTSRVSGNYGEITVSGLWIHNDGCMEGPIGLAHADIDCHVESDDHCVCSDKVTGGGWICTEDGYRANFGVGGGMQNGQLWGHLNYIDHGERIHVKATEVTSYSVVDATTRQITYKVTVNGAAATATVIVSDKGEPGRNDTFAISLSTGYGASGDLGGENPGGGNIQLHKMKCKPNGGGGGGGGGGGHDDDDDGNGHDDDDDGKGHDDDDDDGKGHDDDDDDGKGHDDDDDDGKGHDDDDDDGKGHDDDDDDGKGHDDDDDDGKGHDDDDDDGKGHDDDDDDGKGHDDDDDDDGKGKGDKGGGKGHDDDDDD